MSGVGARGDPAPWPFSDLLYVPIYFIPPVVPADKEH
jgi:hypothetical protein